MRPEFLEDHATARACLWRLLRLCAPLCSAVLPPKLSTSVPARVVQVVVALVGDDLVQVAGDGADVLVDGPLVIVEHDDQPLGLLGDVVQRLET